MLFAMNHENHVTHEEIRDRAYSLWERAGRPEGCETEHWLRAESELIEERTQAQRMPGSASPTPVSATPSEATRAPNPSGRPDSLRRSRRSL